jgi:hypothetical protein
MRKAVNVNDKKGLSYDIKTTIREVLNNENIAFVDEQTYNKLWAVCSNDSRCLLGNYDKDYLKQLINLELQQYVFNYYSGQTQYCYSY